MSESQSERVRELNCKETFVEIEAGKGDFGPIAHAIIAVELRLLGMCVRWVCSQLLQLAKGQDSRTYST